MVAGRVLSRTRSAAIRNDVVYFCSSCIDRAGWIDRAASVHSRPGSRAARLIGKMAWWGRNLRPVFPEKKVSRAMRSGISFKRRNISSAIHRSLFWRSLRGYARPFFRLLANPIKEARSSASTACERNRRRVSCSALSGKSGKAKGSIETSDFRV
jgi:hypothetical protein